MRGGGGSALIRKLKFRLLHFRSFSSTFPVKKIEFIVRGHCHCTLFAQQHISENCGLLRSTIPRLNKTVRFDGVLQQPEFRRCNSNHSQDIRPGMFGEFHHFAPIRSDDFSKFGFKRSRIWKKL